MTRKYRYIIILVLLVIAVSACRHKDSDDDNSSQSNPLTPDTTLTQDTTSTPDIPTDTTGTTPGDHDSSNVQGPAFDENGASYALFSVSATQKVKFSSGNLQYKASSNLWRFAEHQYDCVGTDNSSISSTTSTWIDLFGWGTSGWPESGATYYQPYDYVSTNQSLGEDYYSQYGPTGSYSLTDEYELADWGRYNAISNGGNSAGQWRTLSMTEWSYLFFERQGAANLYATATICGEYKGVILLPDDWSLPNGITFTAGQGNAWNTNNFTSEQWDKMERAGAIFLPSAGFRQEKTIYNVNTHGFYFSSTYYNDGNAYFLNFTETAIYTIGFNKRSYGHSVRLVKDVEQ